MGLVYSLADGNVLVQNFFKQSSANMVHVAESPLIKKEDVIVQERFDGRYVSFAHPSLYKPRSHETEFKKESNVLEKAFFSQEGMTTRKIVVTVEKLSRGKIEDSASYKLRVTYPERYKKEGFSYGEIQGVEFTADDSQSVEKVFFVQKENLLIIMAFSGLPVADDAIDTEAENIIRSIRWLN